MLLKNVSSECCEVYSKIDIFRSSLKLRKLIFAKKKPKLLCNCFHYAITLVLLGCNFFQHICKLTEPICLLAATLSVNEKHVNHVNKTAN